MRTGRSAGSSTPLSPRGRRGPFLRLVRRLWRLLGIVARSQGRIWETSAVRSRVCTGPLPPSSFICRTRILLLVPKRLMPADVLRTSICAGVHLYPRPQHTARQTPVRVVTTGLRYPCRAGTMQDAGCGLRRMILPRTWVHRRRGAAGYSPGVAAIDPLANACNFRAWHHEGV